MKLIKIRKHKVKNKIMKNTSIQTIFSILLICLFTGVVSSCKKNDIDDSGQFDLKVIHAAAGLGAQSFTLAGHTLISGGLRFGDATGYISSASGTRLVAEFKNEGTNDVTAKGEIYTARTIDQTIFLVGVGTKTRVEYFTDDLSSPNNGKVKIKFIHLSDNIPTNIKIRNGAGEEIIDRIGRNSASGYKNIAPGTSTFQLSAFDSGTNQGTFDIPDLQAGKIYTIYFFDNLNGTLVMSKVVHN